MANNLYTPTGNPGAITRGASALIRAEFVLIATAIANSPLLADLVSAVASWVSNVNGGGFKLTNLAPTITGDPSTNAATKGYVDSMAFNQALPATTLTFASPVIRSGAIGWELPPNYYGVERSLRYYRQLRAGLNL